jgi:hypothetical protein
MNQKYGDYEAQLKSLKYFMRYKKAVSIDELCEHVSDRQEWQRRDGTPYVPKTVQEIVRRVLQSSPENFVAINADQWRLRKEGACSFCLHEDVYVCSEGRHFICLDCAELVVEALQEKRAMQEQIAANEAAILSFKEIIGA